MTRKRFAVFLCSTLALIASCGPPDRQSPEALVGHWLGNVSYRDATAKLEFDIERQGDSLVAYFTSDEMLVRDRPIGRVSFDRPRVHFVIPDERAPFTFDGWLRRNIVVGTLTSTAFPNPGRKATLPQLSLRHTHPSMFPYRIDTLVSAGTRVYTPSLQGPYPAVVLVPDPDRPLGVSLEAHADHFARAGFVALLLGPDGDLAHAFQMLRARRDVDGRRIGLWGFGRGATRAASVAAAERAAFVVALSPEPAAAGVGTASSARRIPWRSFESSRVHRSAADSFDWPREAPGVIDSMITWMRARSLER